MRPRIIVDANVLVSAYGVDGEVRRLWRDSLRDYRIVISPEIFIEVEARLRNGEFTLSASEIKSALKDIAGRCDFVRPNAQSSSGFAALNVARHEFPDGVPPVFLLTTDDRLSGEAEIEGCRILRIEDFCNSLRQLQAT